MATFTILDNGVEREATTEEAAELAALQQAAAAAALPNAQAGQVSMLNAAYVSAIAQPVTYISKGGVTETYQADPVSIGKVQDTLLGYQSASATPSGFYWVAADNTQVPFTYADLQGLAAAMMAQGWVAFQHLQTQKAAVLAATTIPAVQAITW